MKNIMKVMVAMLIASATVSAQAMNALAKLKTAATSVAKHVANHKIVYGAVGGFATARTAAWYFNPENKAKRAEAYYKQLTVTRKNGKSSTTDDLTDRQALSKKQVNQFKKDQAYFKRVEVAKENAKAARAAIKESRITKFRNADHTWKNVTGIANKAVDGYMWAEDKALWPARKAAAAPSSLKAWWNKRKAAASTSSSSSSSTTTVNS